MAKAKNAKAALPYVQRLAEDEFVQEQLREAISGLRSAYGRARKQGSQAPQDKRLHDHVRQAATSTRRVLTALQRPKPEPKRGMRKVAAVALAAGGGAVLIATRGRGGQNAE